MKLYLGIDIGSVSIKYTVINEEGKILKSDYFRTKGDVIGSIKSLLKQIKKYKFSGIATTGSARKFIGAIIKADFDVDEITAHRTAIRFLYPSVKTIFEIGGQDSKLIYFSHNSVNFEMNQVCAAGTGSFLDQQASRLGYTIEKFCEMGMKTSNFHPIASKCTVFAETDMIHAQQSGVPINEIIRGVHRGLVNNYFAQMCKGKKLKGDFLFEGGTSQNAVLIDEFANKLIDAKLIKNKRQLIVPKYNLIIGAIGAALLCKNKKLDYKRKCPQIKKFAFLESKECHACANDCGAKITVVNINGEELTIGKSCQQ